jgi:hypothetical protein
MCVVLQVEPDSIEAKKARITALIKTKNFEQALSLIEA